MRSGTGNRLSEDGVSSLIEYILISGILMALIIILMFAANAMFMEGPAERLSYAAFADIGNGVSVRIIDVYSIAPDAGDVTTKFDIPDEVAERDYFITIENSGGIDQVIEVRRDYIASRVSLSGIGATPWGKAAGDTTGRGINQISYLSTGYDVTGG